MEAEETMECLQEFPEHHKMILDRLNEQREQDRFTDITLIVDGHHFKAHKAVLAACSKFFYKFFQEFTQEPLVEIEGVSKMAFRHLIEFTYTAKLMIQGEEEANDVWKAAEFLQMLEAIKALEVRNKENAVPLEENTTGKNEAKKRKIAETSNVITESLPSAESEPVEIEVEIAEGTIEVEDEGIETLEEVASDKQCIKYIQSTGSSDDSALALLADITSKYRQGERKGQIQEDGCASDPISKQVEGIEIVELQLSHVKDLFHCEKCNRSFKLFYHFKEHMKSHSTESFKCEICNKRYLRESAWKQHLNCYHLEEGGVSKKQRTGKKIHICQYCEKQFDHFGHFKEHLRKHTGEKPFECSNCHERFARNSTLKCHLTACQTGVGAKKGRKKLYECQVCNSVFNSWDQFKDHLVIHTGDKPNHCTLCDLWFMQGNELRRHLSDAHNISERLVTEEVLSVETHVQTEPVTSMTIIEQVGKVHVLPLLQVQVDSAQVTVEQVHSDLLQDSQVHDAHMSELPEQVQVSYLEVGRIQTEEGTEVHVEELHVERVNQMPVEVQTELLEADLDHMTPEIMSQEEGEPSHADAAETAMEDHEDAEDLETKQRVYSQAGKARGAVAAPCWKPRFCWITGSGHGLPRTRKGNQAQERVGTAPREVSSRPELWSTHFRLSPLPILAISDILSAAGPNPLPESLQLGVPRHTTAHPPPFRSSLPGCHRNRPDRSRPAPPSRVLSGLPGQPPAPDWSFGATGQLGSGGPGRRLGLPGPEYWVGCPRQLQEPQERPRRLRLGIHGIPRNAEAGSSASLPAPRAASAPG